VTQDRASGCVRIAVPGRAADADPLQHLTCGKFNSRSLVAGFRRIFADPLPCPNNEITARHQTRPM